MILKILYSIFVLSLNFLIYMGINKRNFSFKQVVILIFYGIFICILNYSLDILPSKLILLLILFSASIIILDYFKKNVNVYQKSNLLDKEKVEKMKFILVNIVMPAMITIYELLMIWSDKLLNNIFK